MTNLSSFGGKDDQITRTAVRSWSVGGQEGLNVEVSLYQKQKFNSLCLWLW